MSQDDITSVKMLAVPPVKTREFAGIAQLKIDKKDRHMKTLHEFSKFLEQSNEALVQETLSLSRDLRETLEEKEIEFQKIYNILEDSEFLIVKSESDLLELLKEYKRKVKQRSMIVEQYAADLDNTETKRTVETGAELKKLVDKLIAIAHALPDDIEHTVEAEAFEINTEIINNRKSHTTTLGALRITQVTVEATTIQNWETARLKWRQLRHDKALNDFEGEITSMTYFDPQDRQSFMHDFQSGQRNRHHAIRESLNVILALSCQNISSEAVQEEQANLASINEHEISAIKDCYDGINLLRDGLNTKAKRRVEALRMELHTYGALQREPDLAGIAVILQKAVNDESLADLWRLGGGLKGEFQAQIGDMTSEEVIYEHIVAAMKERLEVITCSFPLRALEEERGKAAQLDKMKSLVTKMRSAPRSEVPVVLRSVVPELEDIITMEALPSMFKTVVREIIDEINVELTALEKRVAAVGLHGTTTGGQGHTLTGTAHAHAASSSTMKSAMTSTSKTATKRTSAGGATTTGFGKTGKRTGFGDSSSTAMMSNTAQAAASVDSMLVKTWNRRLGILFYGSDLPNEYQDACIQALKFVNQQKECNDLVDKAVSNQSDKRLQQIDRKYKKHISNIVSYLEVQATNLSVATTNVGDFYLSVAKVIEAHRKQQKALDDQSADEIWDLKEDFRFELEDREATYETACQQIREATKQEDLAVHFEHVLGVLEEIQQSYRNYHSKACFASDKYPLMLLHEFYSHLRTLSSAFYLSPQPSHLVASSYEALFDQTIRFNKKFFDEKPQDAAGFERIPLLSVDANEETADNYCTVNMISDGQSKENAFAGRFTLTEPHHQVLTKFKTEAFFAPPDPNLAMDSADGGGRPASPSAPSQFAAQLLKKEPHPQCPFVNSDCIVLPLSPDELAAMDEDEQEEYALAISKGFLSLDPAVSSDPAVLPVVNPVLATLTPEVLQLYNHTKELVQTTRQRVAEEAEASYILAHPPVDVFEKAWVSVVAVTDDELTDLWSSIRDSVFSSLEFESFQRVRAAERLNDDRKTEYTDRLEDQIRNHWPRRGRVETQIKQPREAELLGHKEKTWRHIQNIQAKMLEAQTRFSDGLVAARSDCDTYIHEMTALRNTLSGDTFKNLASLQGVDVKARGTTLSFQANCTTQVNVLNQITTQEAESVAYFARDFRKICPLQVAGAEGGYSQSEIDEIEVLVEGQCAEIESIAQEWSISVQQLQEQQEQSMKCQEDFTLKYDKCVQDLAMSEGLGQKYGAPRRRAQERIRTEVSRDEQSAGNVDEMLAKLEFICSEAALRDNTVDSSNAQDDMSVNSAIAKGPETIEAVTPSGRDELKSVTISWGLLNELKNALQIRATYLNVIATPLQIPSSLPWMSRERIALSGTELSIRDFPASKITLEDMFSEVDAICRKETKELYESEGKGSVLGHTGIPDSLQLWLTESKNKLLGRHGHREKAWKRFWGQVERSEALFARNLVENEESAIVSAEDKYSIKLGVPAICAKYLAESFMVFAAKDRVTRVAGFKKLLVVWEKGREKHERLLRPKLGSPDMIDELCQLDTIELQRSTELVENVNKFRSLLIRALSEHLMKFCEDMSMCTKGLVLLMDSTLRLEVLLVPPDTTVPKKHMTMKKLRKAQRIQEAIAAGQEDRSQSRLWSGLDTTQLVSVLKAAEDMVTDLGSNPADTGGGISPRGAAVAPLVVDKKAAAAAKKGAPAAVPLVVEVKPSLVPEAWLNKLKEISEVTGRVGTSHRILMTERDSAVKKFTEFVATCLEDIREDYDTVLRQEGSWNERWRKQVEMLKMGNL